VTAADFTITEDGVEQQVALFDRESLPLSLCIVFDASGSMGQGSIPEFAAATLHQLLTRLLPEDEVSIVAFAERPEVVAPWTPAPDVLKMVVKLGMRGATSLNDGLLTALGVINQARNPRPVILVISDGGENSSRMSLADIVTTRRQSETLVYAFGVSSPSSAQRRMTRGPDGSPAEWSVPPPVDVLPRVVGDSGGVAYRVHSGMDAVRLASAFVDDLRFQYTIGYTPVKPLDGKYRRVKVELKKRGFKIRHRGGYLALPAAP
jgi:VWFA-related protein